MSGYAGRGAESDLVDYGSLLAQFHLGLESAGDSLVCYGNDGRGGEGC